MNDESPRPHPNDEDDPKITFRLSATETHEVGASFLATLSECTTFSRDSEDEVRYTFPDGTFCTARIEEVVKGLRVVLQERSGSADWLKSIPSRVHSAMKRRGHRIPSRSFKASELTVSALLDEVPDYMKWITTLDSVEAGKVADLAEQAGHKRTAELLYTCVELAEGEPFVPLPDLLPLPDDIWNILFTLQIYLDQYNSQQALKKVQRALGGMKGKRFRQPRILEDVASKLQEDPDLSPRKYWQSITVDDQGIYKSICSDDTEVLKVDDESHTSPGIKFSTLQRYFTLARSQSASQT